MRAFEKLSRLPWYTKYPLIVICLFALWTAHFNSTCQSDGCIGVGIPLGATMLFTAIQLLIAIPVYVGSRARQREGAVSPALLAGASVLPAIVAFLVVAYR